MIRYTLRCDKDHQFESWFQNGAAFEKLLAAGQVNCVSCGSKAISKTLMAPAVAMSNAVSAPLEKMRAEIEANSEYVGLSFAQQARDMHDGVIPERAIYGEAKADEARKLLADGIPVLPLPFIPRKKTN